MCLLVVVGGVVDYCYFGFDVEEGECFGWMVEFVVCVVFGVVWIGEYGGECWVGGGGFLCMIVSWCG